MVMQTVLGFVAYVADTGGGVPAILKQGKVYSVNDVGLTTPLACRDMASEAVIPNPVSNTDGIIPGFKVSISDTASGILWKSGDYTVYQPFLGVKGDKGDKGDVGNAFPTVAAVTNLPTASSNAGKAYWVTATKQVYVSDGATWSPMARISIDQSAGRTVKVWDYLNNREQMIYGDTGIRILDNDPAVTTAPGSIKLRRTGSHVELFISDKTAAVAGNPLTLVNIPPGFRPFEWLNESMSAVYDTTLNGLRILTNGAVMVYVINAGDMMRGHTTWTTTEPCPTTLPGTASGGIPA